MNEEEMDYICEYADELFEKCVCEEDEEEAAKTVDASFMSFEEWRQHYGQ